MMKIITVFLLLMISVSISKTSEYDQNREDRIDRIKEIKKENIVNRRTTEILYTLRQIESSNNYEARGLSGEYGAYQFMPLTWEYYSIKYFDEVLDITKKYNQDRIANRKIRDLIEQGYSNKEIASIWNSGSPNWANKIGTNSQGVDYNTPNYVEKCLTLYNFLKQN